MMFKRQLATLLAVVTWVCLCAMAPADSGEEWSAYNLESLRGLAVQNGGRFKPLDTFARETVRFITGKAKYKGQDPVFTILLWMADPQHTAHTPLIEIRNLALKRELNLKETTRWFSFSELVDNLALRNIQERVHQLSRSGARLTGKDRAADTLLQRMVALQDLVQGRTLRIIPNKEGLKKDWYSVSDLKSGQADLDEQQAGSIVSEYDGMLSALNGGNPSSFNESAAKLAQLLKAVGPYPSEVNLAREIHYNRMHPFRLAWILYTVAALVLLFPGTTTFWLGVLITALGFVLHGYGFYLRTLIAGRAPVTNMYESVVWAAFGAMLFALILGLSRRHRLVVLVADVCAVVALILADNLPAVLDPSIKPLAPVLRNNFWLTTHVLTITLGYAAFLLALGLGHVVLWQVMRSGKSNRELDKVLYRTLQVGVLLLAAGTILGGVWANYSWGRFWGWDPKEVWALIALLGYLALLHGRYCGWVRSFEMGVGAILAFLLVLMAWYGVNFVLGAGLHSYGFGTGGVEYVAAYVVLELIYVGIASWKHYKKGAPGPKPQAR